MSIPLSCTNLFGILSALYLSPSFYKKKKFHGQVFLFYAIWYGAGRAFIEGLRTDSLYLGPIRISQLVSAVICAAGIILMVIGCMRAPRAHLPAVVKTAAKAGSPQRKKIPNILRKTSASEEILFDGYGKCGRRIRKCRRIRRKRIRQNQRKRTMAKIIDGKRIAAETRARIRKDTEHLLRNGITPRSCG